MKTVGVPLLKMSDIKHLGEYKTLKAIRKDAGVPQKQIAWALGVTAPKIYQLEIGRSKLSTERALIMARVYKVPIAAILVSRREP